MNPEEQPQQPNTTNNPPSNGDNSKHDSANNIQSGYDWIASYDEQPDPSKNKNSSTKKLMFIILMIILIIGFGIITLLLSSKKDSRPNTTPNTPASEQKTEEQEKDPDSNSSEVDTTRKDKLKKLQEQLDLYYQAFGYYPSFNNANDKDWLDKYGVKQDELKDPKGNQTKIMPTPTSNYFSYQPKPENCDNKKTKCIEYTIGTVLENTTVYELKNTPR